MITLQNMYDQAAETGASHVYLWAFNRAENYTLKVTDDGYWYFVDTKEHLITEEDAQRLLDVWQIGYLATYG